MMKKIALLLMLAVGAIACQKEEILELSEPDQKLVLPGEGGSTSLRFTSSSNWTAGIKDGSWCKATPDTGTPGSVLIEVTGEANEGEESREAVLVISNETLVKEITIVQDCKGSLDLEGDKKFEVSMWGGEIKLTINHNIPYELVLPDWITVPETKSTVTDEVILNVAAQPQGGEARRGTIVIDSEAGNKSVIVKQAEWIPVILIEDPKVEIPSKGGEASFKVVASLDYEVTLSDNNWVEFKHEGNVYTLKAKDANKSIDQREVSVDIKATDPQFTKVDKKLKVIQKGSDTIEGQAVAWTLHLTTLKDFNVKNFSSVAKYGEMILLANSDKIIVLNAKDGSYMQTIKLPSGVIAENIVVDNGGNILFCGNVAGTNKLPIYQVTDIQNMKAKVLVEADPKSVCPSGVDGTGNLRVVGDVTKNAVVTVVSRSGGAHMYGVYCEITNGKAGKWGAVSAAEWDNNVFWGPDLGCIISRGETASEGFYGDCYNAPGPYDLFYYDCDTKIWNSAYVTKCCGKDNFHGMARADFDGKKYLAMHVGAHFPDSDARTMLFDITDAGNVLKHFELKLGKFVKLKPGDNGMLNEDWAGGARSSDVSLNVSGKTMYMCTLDVRYNVLSCVTFE